MLPKNKKLDRKTLKSIMDEKRVISSSLFLFFYKSSDFPHYAFITPKSIFRKSVNRNKYRRIGYNTLRKLDIKIGSGVFLYKKNTQNALKEDIEKDIVFILKRVKFI